MKKDKKYPSELSGKASPGCLLPRDEALYRRSPVFRGIECTRAHYTGFRFKRHFHLDYAVGVIEEGVHGFHYRGGKYDVGTPSRVITFNPGEVHDGWSLSEAGYRLRVLSVDEKRVEQFLRDTEATGGARAYFSGPVHRDPRLARRLLCLHRFLERNPESAEPLEGDALLSDVMSLLFHRHGELPAPSPPHSLSGKRVRKIREFMEAHLHRKITLEELAGVVNLSPYYFLRMFKAATGMTPHAYLIRLRVEAAKRLLACGGTVCDAAQGAGFYDQSHFTRNFKEAYRTSPGDYAAGLGMN